MAPRRLTRLSNRGPRSSSGFTYIGLLIFIALMGIGLALAGQVWHTATQREKEKELLFVGDQFRTAITKYYEGSPGGVKKFPVSLEDLLDDRRYPATKRHLRKIYRDPMTGEARWGLVESPTGGIMGVYSLSKSEPRKTAGFRVRDEAFTDAASYADWKFGYTATAVVESEAGAAPAPGATPINPIVPPTRLPSRQFRRRTIRTGKGYVKIFRVRTATRARSYALAMARMPGRVTNSPPLRGMSPAWTPCRYRRWTSRLLSKPGR